MVGRFPASRSAAPAGVVLMTKSNSERSYPSLHERYSKVEDCTHLESASRLVDVRPKIEIAGINESIAPAIARAVPPAPKIRAFEKVRSDDARADKNPEPSVEVPCHVPFLQKSILAEPILFERSSKRESSGC